MRVHRRQYWLKYLILATPALVAVGCNEREPIDSRLTESDLAPGPVTAYGITLTAESSPTDVAFVLLNTLREDREAVAQKDSERRGELFRRACRLAAADKLVAEFKRMIQGSPMTEKIVPWRAVREIVLFWRPITAHYAASIPADPTEAAARMFEDKQRAAVYCDVTANDGSTATLQLDMVHTAAGWRVGRIGFSERSASAKKHDAGQSKAVNLADPSTSQPS